MSECNGYAPIRRGLLDHVSEGRMSGTMCYLYMCLIIKADHRTGVWRGSAGLASALFDIPVRTARHCMESLEVGEYIKRFMVQGSKSSYPILINKYLCSDGINKGLRLNATLSTSCTSLIYSLSGDQCSELSSDEGSDEGSDVAATTRIEKKEVKEHSVIRREYPEEFERLWKPYPLHKGKAEAFKAFKKLHCQNGDIEQIIHCIEVYKTDQDWTKDNGSFIPHLSTFLNQRRFEDVFDFEERTNKNGG